MTTGAALIAECPVGCGHPWSDHTGNDERRGPYLSGFDCPCYVKGSENYREELAGCRLMATYNFNVFQDLRLGGKGEVCPHCLQSWQVMRRKPLSVVQGNCDICYKRRIKGIRALGGYAAMGAHKYLKEEEGMTQQAKAQGQPTTALSTRVILADEKRAVTLLAARFPQDLRNSGGAVNLPAVQQLISIALTYDLDPFMDEVVPYESSPYVTIQGWQRKALETNELVEFDGDIAKPEDYQRLGIDQQVRLLAWGKVTRQYKDGRRLTITEWATIKLSQTRPSEKETAAGRGRPITEEPWRMVIKRAKKRALQAAFRDTLKPLLHIPSLEDAVGGPDVIEASYDIETSARVVEEDLAPAVVGSTPPPPREPSRILMMKCNLCKRDTYHRKQEDGEYRCDTCGNIRMAPPPGLTYNTAD